MAIPFRIIIKIPFNSLPPVQSVLSQDRVNRSGKFNRVDAAVASRRVQTGMVRTCLDWKPPRVTLVFVSKILAGEHGLGSFHVTSIDRPLALREVAAFNALLVCTHQL